MKCGHCKSNKDVNCQIEWLDNDVELTERQKVCKPCHDILIHHNGNRCIGHRTFKKYGRPIWWVADVIGEKPGKQMTLEDVM